MIPPRRSALTFALALALGAPTLTRAQATDPTHPAEPPAAGAPVAPAPKPAEAKADDAVKVTPYGFVMVNAFFDSALFAARDYPGQVQLANTGGAFLMSARQSRIGVKLATKDTAVTGADLAGVLEFDFNGGQLQATNANANASSTGWYNALMRLRIATITATWKTPGGTVAFSGGQDFGLIAPLTGESMAWTASPLFWQSGNLWRRSPQFRLTWSQTAGALGVNAAAAMLSPTDATAPVDDGAGNRSRMPDLEGRLAVSAKASADVNGTVGFGYHWNKRRYDAATAGTTQDLTVTALALDAEVNVMMLTVKGEWYKTNGLDDTYNGLSPGSPAVAGTTTAERRKVGGDGFWVQAVAKPIPLVSLAVGYGQGNVDRSDLTAVTPTADTGKARRKNAEIEAGAFLNIGKAWRFGLEWARTTSWYLNDKKADAMQTAISSQLKF